ncbi:hypothetical protein [Mesorhizobium carmichaelinearum]|uniref:hypothetical protein n=1 Tax=Mesorhizobium carmichaelinearum TaxID=1208188 RepID=UPI0015CCE8F2|nr:hypothetical protein [Mesorhizobium carmichaelinearum]
MKFSGATLFELLDAPLFDAEDPSVPALAFEIRLKFIPCAKILAAIGAVDRRERLGVFRNLQPDRAAVWAFGKLTSNH